MATFNMAGNRISSFFETETQGLEFERQEMIKWRKRAQIKSKFVPAGIRFVKIDLTKVYQESHESR